MALILTCRIGIGQYVYDHTGGFEMKSSWKTLGDSATLKMPRHANLENSDGTISKDVETAKIIKVGDPVEVELGYDGELVREFTGYIAEIKSTVPFEVRCEDEYFWLKRSPVNKTWKNTTLLELLRELSDMITGPAKGKLVLGPQMAKQNVRIDSLRADRTTVAGVLERLRTDYLLCAYFRHGQLFVGLPYTEFTSSSSVEGAEAYFHFQQNVVDSDLSYKRKDDVRLKAKVVAIHPNGKRTTMPGPNDPAIGDKDGEERTVFLRLGREDHPDTYDKDRLRGMAERELAKFKYDGYRGSFTTFGAPYLVHSGVADLEDGKYPERSGRYLVDSVKVSFGPAGFRREIELGKRASS